MKKFILFILIIILVISCVPIMPTPSENDKVNNAEEGRCFYKQNGQLIVKDVTKFEYDGHKYIQFGYRDWQTIVHDPDCDCHNRQQTKTETIIIEKEKKVENNNNNYNDLFNF